MECPDCHEVSDPYAFLLAVVRSTPNPNTPTVQPLAISECDPNPDPDASLKWQQQIFIRRAARLKAITGIDLTCATKRTYSPELTYNACGNGRNSQSA